MLNVSVLLNFGCGLRKCFLRLSSTKIADIYQSYGMYGHFDERMEISFLVKKARKPEFQFEIDRCMETLLSSDQK